MQCPDPDVCLLFTPRSLSRKATHETGCAITIRQTYDTLLILDSEALNYEQQVSKQFEAKFYYVAKLDTPFMFCGTPTTLTNEEIRIDARHQHKGLNDVSHDPMKIQEIIAQGSWFICFIFMPSCIQL